MSPIDCLHDPASGQTFKRVVVFRALQLGDLLCATPALRALRYSLPGARISFVGLPWAREFVSAYDRYLDEFIEFPGFPGMPERVPDLEAWPRFLCDIRERHFDIAIQMHGSGTLSNSIIGLFGARFTAGYYRPDHYCPDPNRFLPYPSVVHEVWRNLNLVQFLGARPLGEELDYRVREGDDEALLEIPLARELLGVRFICIHPGARASSRCWPSEKFAAVADHLAERGYAVVITGSEGERPLAERLLAKMRRKGRAFDFTGKTSLKTLAALLNWSDLVVCNDTGVSHLAVALRRPSIVVFTQSEFLGWPPLNRMRHRVVSRLDGPEPEDVLGEAADLLKTDPIVVGKRRGSCSV